ncbi:hypothetical protein V8F33_010900 [Rhypophila sp. PSN 637]
MGNKERSGRAGASWSWQPITASGCVRAPGRIGWSGRRRPLLIEMKLAISIRPLHLDPGRPPGCWALELQSHPRRTEIEEQSPGWGPILAHFATASSPERRGHSVDTLSLHQAPVRPIRNGPTVKEVTLAVWETDASLSSLLSRFSQPIISNLETSPHRPPTLIFPLFTSSRSAACQLRGSDRKRHTNFTVFRRVIPHSFFFYLLLAGP